MDVAIDLVEVPLSSSSLTRREEPAANALEPQAHRGVERGAVLPLQERTTEGESGFSWPLQEGERGLKVKALPCVDWKRGKARA